ncbi:hypothetical protein E4U30_007399, partial [Claviceps sp. LM220 group G6]
MRLLTTLAFVSAALALVTGPPVQRPSDQQTVQGDTLLYPENAVLETDSGRRITSRDETVSSSEVEKRMPGTQAVTRTGTQPALETFCPVAPDTTRSISALELLVQAPANGLG